MEKMPATWFTLFIAGLALALSNDTAAAVPTPAGPPEIILHHATVVRVDPPEATASAVAIAGGSIVFVGSDEGALALRGPSTRVVDLAGRTIIPGLIDAHGHVSSLGFSMVRVDATGTRSPAEVAARLRDAALKARPGSWIRGRGWDQNDWDSKEFPDTRLLDEAAPTNPVALARVDGHALWVNRRALETAGITRKTPDPQGGRILRDVEGRPTGILVDNAIDLVEAKIPAPDRPETRQAILRALNRCLNSGLTQVHDAGVPPEEVSIYRELAAAHALPIRVYVMLGGEPGVLAKEIASPPVIGLDDGFLTIRAVKLFMDGALGSRGAALFEEYADEPGNRGLVVRPVEEIRALAAQAHARGYQVCIHAIGDRGNSLALDALEGAPGTAYPGDHRSRIEHAQVLRREEIPRFRSLGIIASMQPIHATSDMSWAEARLGPRKVAGAYAWRQVLDSGAVIAGGSDFPVEPENPFLGLYAAMTRQDLEGRPPGGWLPQERMTPEEALRAFTISAAYAGFQERWLGSISVGKKADLVILPANPLTAPVSELPGMKPEAVIVNGCPVRAAADLRRAFGPLSSQGGKPCS